MYIINQLDYEKQQDNNWKHVSTRLIKTFPEREQAEKYLENCLMINTYLGKEKQEYKMEKVGQI